MAFNPAIRAFQPDINTPFGTYLTDGVRGGPSYGGVNVSKDPNGNNIVGTDANGNLIVGYYDKYGPGTMISPANAWNIVPYPTTAGNIVAQAAVAAAGNLTLTSDAGATNLILSAKGKLYVQFDWPRVPSVVIAGGNLGGAVNVTVYGTDWYGFPLQHTYAVQNAGTYPANLATPAKAFYRVNRVYCDGIIGGGVTLAVQTSSIFGLPYVIKEPSLAGVFSWAGDSMLTQSGIATLVAGVVTIPTPAYVPSTPLQLGALTTTNTATVGTLRVSTPVARTSFQIQSSNNGDVSVASWTIPNGGQNLIAPADQTPVSTATTGDVRGLIQLPGLGETWGGGTADGLKRLVYIPYVYGADTFQSQLAAGGQPQYNPIADSSKVTPPLTREDLYGVNQFYTGV